MKKIIAILVIATILVACDGKASAPAASVDSTKVVDSVKVDSSSIK